jgi:putative intracellular protease/amidase
MTKKRILIVISEWGFWGEELVAPLDVFHAHEYQTVFCTPTGKRPHALPPSMDPTYIDPPLGKSVTTAEMADKVKAINDLSDQRLADPKSLASWFPERPYWSGLDALGRQREDLKPEELPVLRQWERYYRDRAAAQAAATTDFDALLLVGGSGPMLDLVNNYRVHDLILGFVEAEKPVAAECYAVACLAQARDYNIRKSIIWGKHVTGHAIEYDYKDRTGVLDPETGQVLTRQKGNWDEGSWVNLGTPFYTLEYILRDATGPDGQFHGNVGHATSVIVDFPFITGRSTPDSQLTGEKLISVLEGGLRRFGW